VRAHTHTHIYIIYFIILYDDVERYYIERTRIIILYFIRFVIYGADRSTLQSRRTPSYIIVIIIFIIRVHDVMLYIYNKVWHTHNPNNNNKNRESAL